MAFCKVMMCHLPAMWLSIAPAFPRRGDVIVEVISRGGRRVPSGWCLAVSRTDTFRVDDVTLENGLRVRFYPGRKIISYGRDIFLVTR